MPPFDTNRPIEERVLELEIAMVTLMNLLRRHNIWNSDEFSQEYEKNIQIATKLNPNAIALLMRRDVKD